MPEPVLPSVLARILGEARASVAARTAASPPAELRRRADDAPPVRDFGAALRAHGLSLIAEFKRASPSKGPIRPGADPVEIARTYAESGARAISVLTNETHFQGSNRDLVRVREAVDLPVLRKDFTVDAYQLYEARAIGADAVLLIVAALGDGELAELLSVTHELGMAALVEAHTGEEVDRALAVGADIIGINNRNLHTFHTGLETTERLRGRIPACKVVVSESGIYTHADAQRLRRVGVDALLVGESLMRSTDIGEHIACLLRT